MRLFLFFSFFFTTFVFHNEGRMHLGMKNESVHFVLLSIFTTFAFTTLNEEIYPE